MQETEISGKRSAAIARRSAAIARNSSYNAPATASGDPDNAKNVGIQPPDDGGCGTLRGITPSKPHTSCAAR